MAAHSHDRGDHAHPWIKEQFDLRDPVQRPVAGECLRRRLPGHDQLSAARITNNATGHVFYCKTHAHSTMGVATGATIVSTKFDVPSGIETGASKLVVVANGIPSVSVVVTVN